MKKLQITYALITISKILVVLGALASIAYFSFAPPMENLFVGTDHFQPHLGDIFWEIESKSLEENLRTQLPPLNEPMVLTVNQIGISLPMTTTYRVISIILVTLYSAYVFLLLQRAGAIIKRIKLGAFFSQKNTKALKQIGLLVTLAPFLESIITSSFMSWIGLTYHAEGMSLHSEGHLGAPVVILGLLITALAMAFDQGRKLQEEQELTI